MRVCVFGMVGWGYSKLKVEAILAYVGNIELCQMVVTWLCQNILKSTEQHFQNEQFKTICSLFINIIQTYLILEMIK